MNIKQIIKEELKALNENWGERDYRSLDDAKVGDYVELSADDTGYEKSIELIDPKDFKPVLSPYGGEAIKLLAKIVQVAGDEPSDEPSEKTPELTPEQRAQSDALAFKPGTE